MTQSFTQLERAWVNEVFQEQAIARMLRHYSNWILLHRVRRFSNGALGQTRGNHIAIASTVYQSTLPTMGGDGRCMEASAETVFKMTLIHELWHVIGELSVKAADEPGASSMLSRRLQAISSLERAPLRLAHGKEVEEDLALSVSYYLVNESARRYLRCCCPKRFRLLQWYFDYLGGRGETSLSLGYERPSQLLDTTR
jgi:hypothetical protein